MKQKTQLIVLGVLVAVLAVVAIIVLRPKGGGNRPAAAAAAEPAAKVVEGVALPTRDEAGLLVDWLAPQGKSGLAAGMGKNKLGLPTNVPVETGGSSSNGGGAPAPRVAVDPMCLYGVVIRNNKPVALIGDEAYAPGQKVRNTDYTVISIAASSAKLRASDGQEIVLDLMK